MDIQDLLRLNYERLLAAYRENIDLVHALQTSVIGDILPSVVDELDLGPDAIEWAKNWLNDTASIFRIARRNKFTRPFALESIRKNLVWRLQNLWPAHTTLYSPPSVHCLPVRDPFGRPILIVEFVPVDESPEVIKTYVVQAFELLRLHLNSLSSPSEEPVLQYTILLDLGKLSIQTINIDILTWTIREVIPRFPGMLAGVFITNYSWTHSGLWSVIKRLLPKPALSRVFFPTQEELLIAMTLAALPKDYGGSLPFLKDLDDPLRPDKTQSRTSTEGVRESISSLPTTSDYIPPVSSMSLSNPFYGYPTAPARGYPYLQHGRRRKRDLARTLAQLFWMRWRAHITAGAVLAVLIYTLNFGFRRGFIRAPRYFLGWRASRPT